MGWEHTATLCRWVFSSPSKVSFPKWFLRCFAGISLIATGAEHGTKPPSGEGMTCSSMLWSSATWSEMSPHQPHLSTKHDSAAHEVLSLSDPRSHHFYQWNGLHYDWMYHAATHKPQTPKKMQSHATIRVLSNLWRNLSSQPRKIQSDLAHGAGNFIKICIFDGNPRSNLSMWAFLSVGAQKKPQGENPKFPQKVPKTYPIPSNT
jgi:hypothetical protein